MKIIAPALLLVTLSACTTTLDRPPSEQPPKAYHYDPNCARHIPTTRTSQGYPDFNTPEYQEQYLNKIQCR